MVGRWIGTDELMVEILRDVPFFDQSGGGVTFTGGEPLAQPEFLLELLQRCKEQHIHTTVDTSGHTAWENLQAAHPYIDLFLYDLKLVDEPRHIQYTSVTNRLLLSNLRRLSEARAQIMVRIPLLPGINDDDESVHELGAFLACLPSLVGVALMPYHTIGTAKYAALGMTYKPSDLQPPTREQVDKVEKVLGEYDLPVMKYSGRAL